MRRSATLRSRVTLLGVPAVLALLVVLAGPGHAFPGPGGTFVVKENLGVLPGTDFSSAFAINSDRWITGRSGTGGGSAFLWTPQQGMVALQPDLLQWGADISDSGQVVGQASFLDFALDAFSWTAPGPAVYVDPPPGTLFDESASGVNEQGEIVGMWEDPPFRPFLWRAPGPAMDLGTLGGPGGWAGDINESSAVVGAAELPGGAEHAFHWTDGGGIAALDAAGGLSSRARALNDDDEIVGDFFNGLFTLATYWPSPGAPMEILGTVGGAFSRAHDINNAGVIVGESSIGFGEAGEVQAFRKPPGGAMTSLGTLGGDDSAAAGINASGHIVGEADLPGGDRRAVAWWVYKVSDASQCATDLVAAPSPQPAPQPALGIALVSDRDCDARTVVAGTVSLSTRDGDEVLPLRDRGTGRVLSDLRDVDGDGRHDLVVWFDRHDVVRHHGRTDGALWIQGANNDRSNGVYGVLAAATRR